MPAFNRAANRGQSRAPNASTGPEESFVSRTSTRPAPASAPTSTQLPPL